MFGRDPIAFTANNLSAKVSIENLTLEAESRFKTNERMDAWTNGFAPQNLRDHEQGRTDMERLCVQSDCWREERRRRTSTVAWSTEREDLAIW